MLPVKPTGKPVKPAGKPVYPAGIPVRTVSTGEFEFKFAFVRFRPVTGPRWLGATGRKI